MSHAARQRQCRSYLIGFHPFQGTFDGVGDLLLVISIDLVGDGRRRVEAVRFQRILRSHTVALNFILFPELLGIGDHAFDFILRQTTLVIRDRNLILSARALVHGRNVQDTVGIDVEGYFDLRDTAWRPCNTRHFDFAQQVFVFGHRTFTFIDLNQHAGLIVRVGGECLRSRR